MIMAMAILIMVMIMAILIMIMIMAILFMTISSTRKALATIALISIAAGEVIGGATFGFFGHLTAK